MITASNAVHTAIIDVVVLRSVWLARTSDRERHPETSKGANLFLAQAWKQDVKETGKQLRLGAGVARRNVEKVLDAELASGDTAVVTDEEGAVHVHGRKETQLLCESQQKLLFAERGFEGTIKGFWWIRVTR
ncbi:uncharacterized protein yc1106_08663 [Curvularia clavata]|uniref:Uncharacterized protein n=1 Tax=Curvularia clavata TaxID=95742 RepID=A0A9Q8ZEU5_CURCL|nr:uncharacterized protein yc1106_08663 [Curvularia clavata]